MISRFNDSKWRISGSPSASKTLPFKGGQHYFPNGTLSLDLPELMLTCNPFMKITLTTQNLEMDYSPIAVVASTNGHSAYTILLAKGFPAHQPQVCVNTIAPSTLEAAVKELGYQYGHSLLNEIAHRTFHAVFSDLEVEDFHSLGIYSGGLGEIAVAGVIPMAMMDWADLKEVNTTPRTSKRIWRGYLHAPYAYRSEDTFSEGELAKSIVNRTMEKAVEADALFYGISEGEDEGDDAPSGIKEEYDIKPMWQEHSAIIYYNRNPTAQFWIEETRCKTCGQRIIVHLNKGQCPEGTPDTTIRCSACKNDFQFH